MRTSLRLLLFTACGLVAFHDAAWATSPYTEHFTSNNANWYMDAGATNPAVYQAAGGPDSSSYVSINASAFGVPDDGPVILFQARDEFNSSAHAFEGDWIGSGINQFSAYVRHNATIPLVFFARFTRPSGGAGVAAEEAIPVPPNVWKRLSFEIDSSNINDPVNNPDGELFVEGPPSIYNSVFSNVGHVQIGYSVPPGFGMNPNTYTYGLDQPSIAVVPEPATWMVAILGVVIVTISRRRRPGEQ